MRRSRPCAMIKEGVHVLCFLRFTTGCQGFWCDSTRCEIATAEWVAERATGPWLSRSHSMLAESGLPCLFWGEALCLFVHVSNCLPIASIRSKTTPYQLWHGRKPSVAPFCRWGCLLMCCAKTKRTSLGSHMQKCVFIGYPSGYKAGNSMISLEAYSIL